MTHRMIQATQLLSKKDIAERLGVSVKTVERRIADGTFPAYHVGRSVRISVDDFQAGIAQLRLIVPKTS